jgi:SAM-dependent methyltransferase
MDRPTHIACTLCDRDASPVVSRRVGGVERRFFRCPGCLLIFLDPRQQPSDETARWRYMQHTNDPAEPGYRAFLLDLARPCFEAVGPEATCLDYGCGPTRAMVSVFAEQGRQLEVYDPLFFPQWPDKTYDLIVCCEVLEHFNEPREELPRMLSLLKPGGLLAVRTSLWDEAIDLGSWRYMADLTHVSFYHRKTVEHIVSCYGLAWGAKPATAEFAPGVILLRNAD